MRAIMARATESFGFNEPSALGGDERGQKRVDRLVSAAPPVE
jgi:hypothetical protein